MLPLAALAEGVGLGSPDIMIHLHMEDAVLVVEIPLFAQCQRMIGGALPDQGMHHVEAWAIARSLDIQDGDLVLDPMCGRGTLLAEASIWWPNATYVGCDLNLSQLASTRRNFEALSTDVALHKADATALEGIPLHRGAAQKVMLAPPWNRQFRVRGGPMDFYGKMLREVFRVAAPGGCVVLFVNQRVEGWLGRLLPEHAWRVRRRRSFQLTRQMRGVILVLEQGLGFSERLAWEGDAPGDGQELYEHWRGIRAEGFPRLRAV